MKKRLPLWLAVIFAALHLIVIGGVFLEMAGGGGGGEGPAFAVLFYDLPLFVLCKNIPICGTYHGQGGAELFFLVAGTLMYALAGLVIGLAIVWIRTLAHRWDDR